MVSIARKNLLEDLPRFLVAQAGIMFAVSLVTIQTGIFKGFTRSTVLLIEESPADIWVTSEQMVNFELTEPILMSQLARTREVEGVKRAEALLLGSARWYLPSGESTPVKVVGFDPSGQLFQPGNVTQGDLKAMAQPYNVMLDQSRLPSVEVENLGSLGVVGGLPAQLAAITQESQSIVTASFLFTSLENAKAYINAGLKVELNCEVQSAENLRCTRVYEQFEVSPENQVNAPALEPLSLTDPITYVLVEAEPGQNLDQLKQKLEAVPGIRAYTKEEMADKTRAYWEGRTGVGLILSLGAAVGAIVGMVVVSQILYASVSDHIKEFGTLKAMGAADKFLYAVVTEQALWMAVLGYIPGILLCLGVKSIVASRGIIILITPGAAAAVLGLAVVMCVSSGFLAIRKVTRVDPAIVFKA